MSTLAVAIERKQWELVSLRLLVGVVEAAAALPPDAVEGLLEVLAQTGPRPGAGRTGPFDRLRTGRGRRR